MPIYSYKCEDDHITDHLCPMAERTAPKVCKVCREDAHMIITPVKVSLDPTDPAFAGTYMTWERNRAKQMKQEIRLEKKREGQSIFGFPVEVITMIRSTVGGAVMKMWSQSQSDKADHQNALTQRFSASEDSVSNARNYQNANAQWIRRFLVVSFMAMAAFILTAPILGYDTVVPVEVTSGFKFLFLDFTNTITQWTPLKGMVTPEWLPHAIMAVVGMYFGQSIVSRK